MDGYEVLSVSLAHSDTTLQVSFGALSMHTAFGTVRTNASA